MLPLYGGAESNSKQARQNSANTKDGLLGNYRSNELRTWKNNPSYRRGVMKLYRDMSMINPSRSDSLIEVNERRGFNSTERVDLSGIQMVPRQKKKNGIGAGVYCYGTRRRHSSSLKQYIAVFQAEVTPLRHAHLRI
jgi:hypothetical protein